MEVPMGGELTGMGSGDNNFDEEGYDESQRAEILEATRDGPTDGVLLTDLEPDLGDEDIEDEPIDELDMEDGEVGDTDATVDMDEDDADEDAAQDAFDAGEDDEDLDDADDVALRP
jgi:DNA-directed RNA polymerase subunit delta